LKTHRADPQFRRRRKSGGEKISALEIERTLLSLDEGLVKDCAVVGVPDEKWGEAVAAVLVLHEGKALSNVKELREILRRHVRRLPIVPSLL
jgi:malonyl-CoA/methylmalonyl-CoA synthetase